MATKDTSWQVVDGDSLKWSKVSRKEKMVVLWGNAKMSLGAQNKKLAFLCGFFWSLNSLFISIFWHIVSFQKHICYYILSLLRIKTKDLSNSACLFCPYHAFILRLRGSTAVYFFLIWSKGISLLASPECKKFSKETIFNIWRNEKCFFSFDYVSAVWLQFEQNPVEQTCLKWFQ